MAVSSLANSIPIANRARSIGKLFPISRRPCETRRANCYGLTSHGAAFPVEIVTRVARRRRRDGRAHPLDGLVPNAARAYRDPAELLVQWRSGDDFTGLMAYGPNGSTGRRGVRGRLSQDGRRLTITADWWEGNISPEPVRYDLTLHGGVLSGTWRTATLSGAIRLERFGDSIPQ